MQKILDDMHEYLSAFKEPMFNMQKQGLPRGKLVVGAAVGSTLAVAGTCMIVAGSWWRRWRQLERRRAAQKPARPPQPDTDILRTGFSAKKLPDAIEDIVIGSGYSGLYIAAQLSKLGRKVVVLEQHYVAGGCTHNFMDKGFEFDTGVHYIGAADVFAVMFDWAAGRDGACQLQRNGAEDGSNVYSEFYAGAELVHRYRPGMKTFEKDLVDKFPQEKQAIGDFFRAVRSAPQVGAALLIAKQFLPAYVWKALLAMPGPVRRAADKYIRRTWEQALKDFGMKDEMLRAILGAEFGDHGMTPDKTPYFLQATIFEHYAKKGGFTPVGGSHSLAMALIPPILAAGGAVFVRAPVAKIVVENGRAIGVEMAGGKGFVRAKRSVISSAGVEVTYRKLLEEDAVQRTGGPPQSLLASEAGGTSQFVYGFFGFEASTKELGLPSCNLWSIPPIRGSSAGDISKNWSVLFGSTRDAKPNFLMSTSAAAEVQLPAFIAFPSAKDSTYEERCPGKSSAIVIVDSRPQYFGNAGPVNKRGAEYAEVKCVYKELLLKALYRHLPHLEGKVSYASVATPLTNTHYLGRTAAYGLDHTADRFLDPTLRARVPGIQGLFLTGQDLFVVGVFSQPAAATITLGNILGLTSPDFWWLLSDFTAWMRKYKPDKAHYLPANY
eukprot:CAMPEP_0179104762 /NCGR_PEP_ID=MMETSP0796-20121207/48616_1 /TAXON_ID=73915 /ORGANISM="Pyrodinium bahamense, Strain pbaha01" /LENGTH=662 /DNA_ID=CAMNT_0020802721 /DNA_START=88 /DNA_END=2076 /DNA_ORIENTATION=+